MGKTIIFDVDGVLADFVYGYTKEAGHPAPWGSISNEASWDFKDVFSPAVVEETWAKIRNDPRWWCSLPALVSTEVFAQINQLRRDHQVLFVTARVSNHNAQGQTAFWLRIHGIANPSVIVTPKKGDIALAVGASYHIDDKPENAACVHWMADRVPCRSYFLERPSTAEKGKWLPERVRRVATVSEYIRDIEEGN